MAGPFQHFPPHAQPVAQGQWAQADQHVAFRMPGIHPREELDVGSGGEAGRKRRGVLAQALAAGTHHDAARRPPRRAVGTAGELIDQRSRRLVKGPRAET